MTSSSKPHACPHGVQHRKRLHLCRECMEVGIDQFRDALAKIATMVDWSLSPGQVCHTCGGRGRFEGAGHHSDCPVVVARAALAAAEGK